MTGKWSDIVRWHQVSCYLRGVCCWTTRRAVSRRNTSQSGCVMCWSAENGYCWTRQVSHMSSARRRLRELSSAMRWASSGGRFKLSLRHTWCSTWTICQPHTITCMHTAYNLSKKITWHNIIINYRCRNCDGCKVMATEYCVKICIWISAVSGSKVTESTSPCSGHIVNWH